MQSTNINIRMEQELKNQFEAVCSELGLSMSTAINIFAKATVRRQGIPFELTLQHRHPLSISNMSEEKLTEEVLQGYRVAETGDTQLAHQAFAEIREKLK